MKQWHRLAAGGALAVALIAGIAGQAAAGLLVTNWTYEINNGFEAFEVVPGVEGFAPNPVLNAPTRLEWPLSSSSRSSLEVESVQTGSDLQTNGSDVAGATLTHNNFVVPARFADEYLTGGRLSVRVDLTPEGSSESITVETFFDFGFKETANRASCGFESTGNCDDIFVLIDDGGLAKQFTYEGNSYTLLFGSDQFAALDPGACQLVGLGAGCIGFLTPENASTDFRTFIRIVSSSALPVPEPGVLALIGTGLLVLGMARRRRAA